MAAPILAERRIDAVRPLQPSPDRAWQAVAWFGAALALIGFAEAAVYLYPWGFGSREWEFGASAQLLGSLPLPTMGLGMLLASAVALGSRRGLLVLGVLFAVLTIVTWGLLILHWLVVPLALKAPPAGQPVIRQTIGRTTIAGVGFGLMYLAAVWQSVARAKRH